MFKHLQKHGLVESARVLAAEACLLACAAPATESAATGAAGEMQAAAPEPASLSASPPASQTSDCTLPAEAASSQQHGTQASQQQQSSQVSTASSADESLSRVRLSPASKREPSPIALKRRKLSGSGSQTQDASPDEAAMDRFHGDEAEASSGAQEQQQLIAEEDERAANASSQTTEGAAANNTPRRERLVLPVRHPKPASSTIPPAASNSFTSAPEAGPFQSLSHSSVNTSLGLSVNTGASSSSLSIFPASSPNYMPQSISSASVFHTPTSRVLQSILQYCSTLLSYCTSYTQVYFNILQASIVSSATSARRSHISLEEAASVSAGLDAVICVFFTTAAALAAIGVSVTSQRHSRRLPLWHAAHAVAHEHAGAVWHIGRRNLRRVSATLRDFWRQDHLETASGHFTRASRLGSSARRPYLCWRHLAREDHYRVLPQPALAMPPPRTHLSSVLPYRVCLLLLSGIPYITVYPYVT